MKNFQVVGENNITQAEKQRKLKLTKLVDDFSKGDSKTQLKALKSLQIHGDETAVTPLINVWIKGLSEPVEKELIEFFSSLKNTDSTEEIMNAVNNPKFKEKRRELLSTIWNTKVDYSDYLSQFVGIAIEGDFMDTLECLTIIENLEGPFSEENLYESQLHIQKYAENRKSTTDEKATLMSEIAILIKDFEEKVDDLA